MSVEPYCKAVTLNKMPDAAKKAEALGMKEVEVRIKGPGAGRESAVRGIASVGMEVIAIKDITPVPHNGCRPPKRRSV